MHVSDWQLAKGGSRPFLDGLFVVSAPLKL